MLESGFIPALGTPLDEDGYLLAGSFRAQIERQIAAGCRAVLVMGSMGQQACIRNSEVPKIARSAVEQVAGRVPVYVGAMDCSVGRARERMAALEALDIEAFVFTTPYYAATTPDQGVNYFKALAASTRHRIMLYDLPAVTQSKISYAMLRDLSREVPNLGGIKSGDLQLLRRLKRSDALPPDFALCYSNLELFDLAYRWGLTHYLDGMIACTPHNFARLDAALRAGDYRSAGEYLDNVVALRDFFAARGLWPSFSAAMNMLGFAGNFAPDYVPGLSEESAAEIRGALERIGEL